MQHDEALTEELLGLEREFWTALRDKDAEVATRLTDQPSVVVGAQGIGDLDHAALGRMIRDAPWDLSRFDLANATVRRISDDVAVVAYEVKEDIRIDGEQMALKAYDSSVWVRRQDRWVCALHTESIAGDPFGRPR
jgi:hypothetical protein